MGFSIQSVLDDFGDVDPDMGKSADALATERNIGITSDRQLLYVAVNELDEIVGAAWYSVDDECYQFDVVVKSGYERRGVGSSLTDSMISARGDYAEAYNYPPMILHVVSQQMKLILESRGFVVTSGVGKTSLIMELKDEFALRNGSQSNLSSQEADSSFDL